MTPLPPELEALMPEPAAITCIDISSDHEGRVEANLFLAMGTNLHTADQMREAIKAATERAATKATSLATDAAYKYANGYPVDFEKEVGDAIRGGGREG